MRHRCRVTTLLSIALLASVSTSAIAADELKAFPPAKPGMTRHVIKLEPLGDESALQVELLVGKTVKVDARNRYFFGGKLEKETVRGWGYDRYVLHKLGPMIGTLMAVDPGVAKVDRFVALRGEPRLVRYNSRLPLVVYVPAGVEVRYRIWRADPNATTAGQG
jgi:ecotin